MIFVNSEEKAGIEGMTVADFLKKENYKTTFIAVEINGKIIPKSDFGAVKFGADDKVNIVTFVGGG